MPNATWVCVPGASLRQLEWPCGSENVICTVGCGHARLQGVPLAKELRSTHRVQRLVQLADASARHFSEKLGLPQAVLTREYSN